MQKQKFKPAQVLNNGERKPSQESKHETNRNPKGPPRRRAGEILANENRIKEMEQRLAAGDETTVFWNANSLRKRWKYGNFEKIIKDTKPNQIFILEAKCKASQLPEQMKSFLLLEGYGYIYEHVSTKIPSKWGYAGIICFSKEEALAVFEGVGDLQMDQEGRALTLQFEHKITSGIYFPNAGKPGELITLEKKLE